MDKVTTNTNKDRFELLRQLLLEEDRAKFNQISEAYLLQEKLSERVSPLIDKKIEHLKDKFPEYFGDTITKTLKLQIEDSQDDVIEALYPIMGKLIKKSIVYEISKLSEKINKTLKEKFSIKQVFKRLLKGENNDADVILQEVFEPIIEEVFVVEKNSGLLVGSYSKGNIADKDMVSGMLTAIKSFAEDAFHKENQDLEDIKFETFQLSIQNFKSIYIAVACSGVLNINFKEELQNRINSLATIILKKRKYLSDEEKLNKLIYKELITKDYNN